MCDNQGELSIMKKNHNDIQDPIYIKCKTRLHDIFCNEMQNPSSSRSSALLSMPCVIGLSGGADSTFLLHMLVLFYQDMGWDPLSIHAVYIDHGWRKESKIEMQLLKDKSGLLGISFQGLKIDSSLFASGNLEEVSRNERYRLLVAYSQKIGARLIFIGHQQDDQAEGILKRVFEGASFQSLRGMGEVKSSFFDQNILIARPLLSITRKDIEKWLFLKSISFFQDPTNTDSEFTRSRIRNELIPQLSEQFRKQISSPLIKIAREAEGLRQFAERMRDQLFETQVFSQGAHLSVLLSVKRLEASLSLDPFIVGEVIRSLKDVSQVLAAMSSSQIEGIRDVFAGVNTGEKVFQVAKGTALARLGKAFVIPYILRQDEKNKGNTFSWMPGSSPDISSYVWNSFITCSWKCLLKDAAELSTLDFEIPTWEDLFKKGHIQICIPLQDDVTVHISHVTDAKKKLGSFDFICPFSTLRHYLPSLWNEKTGKLLYSPVCQLKKTKELPSIGDVKKILIFSIKLHL